MTLFLSLLTVITCAKKHVVTFPSVNLTTYQDPVLTGIASLGAFFALLIRVLGGAGGGSTGAGGGSTVGSSILGFCYYCHLLEVHHMKLLPIYFLEVVPRLLCCQPNYSVKHGRIQLYTQTLQYAVSI